MPDDKDFHIDMTFTGREATWVRPAAIVTAIAGIIFIIATMTTNVAASLLPMHDDYLQVMIPTGTDGAEPLGLSMLTHEIKEKTITITGSVVNRSAEPVSSILAVVQMNDTTSRFPQTQEILVMPEELQPEATGNFTAMATLQEKPGGYLVKFKFVDGPFIPHKDDRPPSITITPQPTQPIPLPPLK